MMPLKLLIKKFGGVLHSLRSKRIAAWGSMSLLILLFTLSSCYRKMHLIDYDEPTTKSIPVVFTLAVAAPTESTPSLAKSATRASDDDNWDSEDDREKGNGIDNTIDASRLHVVFYDNNGNLAGTVNNIRLTQLSTQTDNGSKFYEVYGNMEVDANNLTSDNTFSGRVVVYANTDSPGSGWEQSLQDITNNYTYSYTLNPTIIPMWGFKTIADLKFSSGDNAANLGDIYLLRAMAKVTVKLTDDMVKRGYTFDGVTLNNYNTVGYVAPEYTNFVGVDSTSVMKMENTFRPNTTSPSTNSLNFVLTSKNDSTEALYIPEYNNNTQTVTSITVRVKHSDGDIRTASFDFGNYTSGNWTSALNIVRNHHYVFSVYGNPIKVNLTVEPWTVVTHPDIYVQ